MKQTMLIVGLGLIGGSLALALKGFEDFEIVGVDVSQPTLRYAAEHGVGDRVTEDAAAELPQADVVALALHPQGIVDFLARYRDAFKPGDKHCKPYINPFGALPKSASRLRNS